MKIACSLIAFVMILTCLCACNNRSQEKTESDNAKDVNKIEIIIEREDISDKTKPTSEDNSSESELSQNVKDKGILYSQLQKESAEKGETSLEKPISDTPFLIPILQNPTDNGVVVQWFTEGECSENKVVLYEGISNTLEAAEDKVSREISAQTFKMSRLRGGKTSEDCNDPKISADIYKHVAFIDGLPEYNGYVSERVAYKICSDGNSSDIYTLAARPKKGTPLKILLTSDLQIKKMCAANYQKVFEKTGHVDAIFINGDIVDVSDRQYDWFFADNAFWKVMSGTANDSIEGKTYYGAPLVQEAPVYTAVGNHDVMGVYDETTDLLAQFNNPLPRDYASELYRLELQNNPEQIKSVSEEKFIEDNSFNTITYEEMFELPCSDSIVNSVNNEEYKASGAGEKYYATTFGDVSLISLDVSRVWRLPNVGLNGKYSEIPGTGTNKYGFGDFIFEPVNEGSEQIAFLDRELNKESYVNSDYKVVMFHSEAHSLGGNALPAFTDPVKSTAVDPGSGQNMTIYNYPLADDYIHTVIEPRLEKSGTNLLFNAHSHLWNRFITDSGMNVLETSNVGNSYGAYTDEEKRYTCPSVFNPSDAKYAVKVCFDESNYPQSGDIFSLAPIAPNVKDISDGQPYVASNSITVFSILDTQSGKVDSYCYDVTAEESDVVLFDSFDIINR